MADMRHYCTLFDSKFLPQGLALYESLKRHSSEPFRLYVLALDEASFFSVGNSIQDSRMDIWLTPPWSFEGLCNLNAIKDSRTWQEWAWTCASNYSSFIMEHAKLDEITYLDADTLFFSDPEPVFAEIGEKSIGIIPHRFPLARKQMEANGKFNVSWVTFRGEIGYRCLETWARQCREWCYYKNEAGKFGDQKYLDEWPQKYGDECVQIQNIGVGAAPWNLSQYKVTGDADGVRLNGQRLIMYHMHEYLHGKRLTNYKLREQDIKLIYVPYISAVTEARKQIDSLMAVK